MAEEDKEAEAPKKTLTTWEMISTLIIVLIIGGSILFSLSKNAISFSNTYLVSLAGIAFLAIVYPASKVLRIRERDVFRAVGSLLIIVFMAGGISITLWSLLYASSEIYDYTTNKVDVPVLTSIAIVFGTLLWKIRVTARAFYGFVEVIAGVGLTAFNAISNASATGKPSPQLYAAVLTGGIFLIVRGLDNMEQGLKFTSGTFADTWVQWAIDHFDAFIAKRKAAEEAAAIKRQDNAARKIALEAARALKLTPEFTVTHTRVKIDEAFRNAKLKTTPMHDVVKGDIQRVGTATHYGGGTASDSSSKGPLTQQLGLSDSEGLVITADQFNNLSKGGKANVIAFFKMAPISYEDSQRGVLRLQNEYGSWVSANEFNQLHPENKARIKAVYDTNSSESEEIRDIFKRRYPPNKPQ